MTIKFLADYYPYKINNTASLTSTEEAALVAAKVATTDLVGGVAYVAPNNSTYTDTAKVVVDRATNNLLALINPDLSRSRLFSGVVAKSAVPISLTGSTLATPLAEIQVPGGLMGLNGGVRVTVYWSMTNNANTKRLLIRWGGIRREVFNLNIASWAAASAMVEISNRGATGSQIANAGGTAESFGQLPGFVTASENTEVDQPIQFVGQLSNVGDTLTIERYTVEYFG